MESPEFQRGSLSARVLNVEQWLNSLDTKLNGLIILILVQLLGGFSFSMWYIITLPKGVHP